MRESKRLHRTSCIRKVARSMLKITAEIDMHHNGIAPEGEKNRLARVNFGFVRELSYLGSSLLVWSHEVEAFFVETLDALMFR